MAGEDSRLLFAGNGSEFTSYWPPAAARARSASKSLYRRQTVWRESCCRDSRPGPPAVVAAAAAAAAGQLTS